MRVMGALRGRSLDFRFGGAEEVCGVEVDTSAAPAAAADGVGMVGLLFCASPSLSTTSAPLSLRCCHGCDGGQDCCCSSLDMLVSGIPSFRGGISGSRVVGRAVSVIKGRFEDCRAGRKEEKGHLCARRHRAQRRVAGGWEAKRKIVANEGPVVRRAAMVGYGERSRLLRLYTDQVWLQV